MAVKAKVSMLVVMSAVCLQSCPGTPERSSFPVFAVEKIEREAGQLFDLKITIKSGKGKYAEKTTTNFGGIRLHLSKDGSESDSRLQQWDSDYGKVLTGYGIPRAASSDEGATREYKDLYLQQEFKGELIATVGLFVDIENSIPFEITNKGLTGVFSLNDATDKLTLQLSNAKPAQQYTINLATDINYLDYGLAKTVTADANGKANSSWTLTNKTDKSKVCAIEFAVKVTNKRDDTRIISTVIEFPCVSRRSRT